ncbi:unnamed protein product [Paramecium pentaurelia]|uniref:Uncharacterized protein n=1 Tax=Paramecium pentaurelia TaxID=43138 RepID=A0A8S1XAW2_9CILI|nr:unnamed protein product [Paramecium pentaurelia]
MSLSIRLVRTPNAAWEKPKQILDEESLILRQAAYDEKVKEQIFNSEANPIEIKEDEEEEEDDVEDIDDYADDLQTHDL